MITALNNACVKEATYKFLKTGFKPTHKEFLLNATDRFIVDDTEYIQLSPKDYFDIVYYIHHDILEFKHEIEYKHIALADFDAEIYRMGIDEQLWVQLNFLGIEESWVDEKYQNTVDKPWKITFDNSPTYHRKHVSTFTIKHLYPTALLHLWFHGGIETSKQLDMAMCVLAFLMSSRDIIIEKTHGFADLEYWLPAYDGLINYTYGVVYNIKPRPKPNKVAQYARYVMNSYYECLPNIINIDVDTIIFSGTPREHNINRLNKLNFDYEISENNCIWVDMV